MRYTTVIDLTEFPELWQNPNVVRLYYFLAMKCGYHDDDRDVIHISLRILAGQTNLTLSAVRHALKVLRLNGLVVVENDCFRVLKFVLERKVTSRTQKNTSATFSVVSDEMRMQEMKREEDKRKYEESIKKKNEFIKSLTLDELANVIAKIENAKGISCRLDNNLIFVKGEVKKLTDYYIRRKKHECA